MGNIIGKQRKKCKSVVDNININEQKIFNKRRIGKMIAYDEENRRET